MKTVLNYAETSLTSISLYVA